MSYKSECMHLINEELNSCTDEAILSILSQIKDNIQSYDFEKLNILKNQFQVLSQSKNYNSSILDPLSNLINENYSFNSQLPLPGTLDIESKINQIIKTSIDEVVTKIETVLINNIDRKNEEYYQRLVNTLGESLKILSQEISNNQSTATPKYTDLNDKKLNDQVDQLGSISRNMAISLKEFRKSSYIKTVIFQSIITVSIAGLLSYFITTYTTATISASNNNDHLIVENLKSIKNNLNNEEKACWNKIFLNNKS